MHQPLPALLRGAAAFVVSLIAALAATPGAARAQAIPEGLRGQWATQGFGSIVELYPCPHASTLLCGRITWLWDATDEHGTPRTDKENPDAGLRGRPLIGIQIIRDFREAGAGTWSEGRLYNPDDGRTYGGSIRLLAAGRLQLQGCALRIFCQSQRWYRPEALLAEAMREAR